MVTFATEDSLCMRKILDVDGVTYFFVRHVISVSRDVSWRPSVTKGNK